MKYAPMFFMFLAVVFTPALAKSDDMPEEYMAYLDTLNDSGVEGIAWITVMDGKYIYVEIEAVGLEAERLHPQHIHGMDRPKKNATCPGMDADADADGVVSVVEGLPYYGPVILPLQAFDLVDEDGNLSYASIFQIRPETLQPLHKRAVVLHGMTINGVYVASTPVACGEIHPVE